MRWTIERLSFSDMERLRAIRLRAVQDAPEAFSLTVDDCRVRPARSWAQELGACATFVATSDFQDIGVVQGAPHDHCVEAAYLVSLWVAPGARRLGVGRALVNAAVDWARSDGRARLFLDVGEQNASAIALYEGAGFVPNGQASVLPPPRTHVREVQFVLML